MAEHPRLTTQKEELFLCMGSACHQLGVYEVLPRLQQLLKKHRLEERVELTGAFCLENCADGISMKHRGRIFNRIKPGNVEAKFEEQILPCLRAALEKGNSA